MSYDAVVVGARCAGAPTAMLLARRGLRVLLVDKAPIPSDILKGHVVKPAGVARLARWGLLDDLLATGCPPVRRRRIRFGDLSDVAAELPPDVLSLTPRRNVLDWILVQGAVKAGVEFRDRCSLADLVWHDDRVTGVELRGPSGKLWRETCSVVVGADGVRSVVARLAGSDVTAAWPPASAGFWAYWSGMAWDVPTTEALYDGRFMGGSPTHGDESLMFVQIPIGRSAAFNRDRVAEYERAMASFAGDRLLGARRCSRVFGICDLPNYFRRSSGPGWALAGDAGHHKDPLAARGITMRSGTPSASPTPSPSAWTTGSSIAGWPSTRSTATGRRSRSPSAPPSWPGWTAPSARSCRTGPRWPTRRRTSTCVPAHLSPWPRHEDRPLATPSARAENREDPGGFP